MNPLNEVRALDVKAGNEPKVAQLPAPVPNCVTQSPFSVFLVPEVRRAKLVGKHIEVLTIHHRLLEHLAGDRELFLR